MAAAVAVGVSVSVAVWVADGVLLAVADGVAVRVSVAVEDGLDVSNEIFNMMMAKENASQRREWMETYGNLVDADIS